MLYKSNPVIIQLKKLQPVFIMISFQQNSMVIACLHFVALPDQLNLPGIDATALRQHIVAFLKSNSEFVKGIDFVAEKYTSFSDYIDDMSKSGVWGEGIVLEAALALFKRPTSILQPDGQIVNLTSPTITDDAAPVRLAIMSLSGGPLDRYVSLKERAPGVNAGFDANPAPAQLQLELPETNSTSNQNSISLKNVEVVSCGTSTETSVHKSSDVARGGDFHDLDIENYVQSANPIPDTVKLQLLMPDHNYNFKSDSTGDRAFRHEWLSDYSPWLSYSKLQRGPLCKYCVLFPQKVDRGPQGAFILKPCTQYKDFHNSAKSHARSTWHKNSHEDATNYIATSTHKSVPVNQQITTSLQKVIKDNRKVLHSIVSCIVYCGTHDIALRGKTHETGNMHDLMDFRTEVSDAMLQKHMSDGPHNARYTSNRTQNELIQCFAAVLRKKALQLQIHQLGLQF